MQTSAKAWVVVVVVVTVSLVASGGDSVYTGVDSLQAHLFDTPYVFKHDGSYEDYYHH